MTRGNGRPRRLFTAPGWRSSGLLRVLALALLLAAASPSLSLVAFARAGDAAAAGAVAPTPSGDATAGTDTTVPNLGPATDGTAVCTVTNTNVDEVTGMVATANGIYAVEGGDTFEPSAVVVWTIDPATCAATSKSYGFGPVDPQDLALGPDGALWVADIGDGIGSDNRRTRLTLERVQPGGSAPAAPYRFLYPPTGKFHAQAMLLTKDGVPIIFTNQAGKAIMYRPDAPLTANADNNLPALTKVGEFVPAKTGTHNAFGVIGTALITGAATSPDGSKVVVRTASDAYEFTVGSDGDVVKAIAQGTPAITPLPNEENGQAITYSADGSAFLTLSSARKPVLRRYQPYHPAARPSSLATGSAYPRSWLQRLSFSDLTTIAIGFTLVGMATMAAGIIGVVLSRRRRDDETDERADGRGARARQGATGRDDGTRRGDGHGWGEWDDRSEWDDRDPQRDRPRRRSDSGHGEGYAAGDGGGPPHHPQPGPARARARPPATAPRGSTYRGAAKVPDPAAPPPQGTVYGGPADHVPADHVPADHVRADHGPPDRGPHRPAPRYDDHEPGRPPTRRERSGGQIYGTPRSERDAEP